MTVQERINQKLPPNLWNDEAAHNLPDLEGLVYRSNLLGRDRSIANIYGCNTSVKRVESDHLGRPTEVLWVKASGSDLATVTEKGFAGLRLAEVTPLLERESMSDEEMLDYLSKCTFAPGRPRQSIETLLHAFFPAVHVDHTHPDAIISLSCAPDGKQMCQSIWGDRMVWVDYIRPGFTLSKWIGEGVRANPRAELVVMAKHGLLTWADTSKQAYDKTINVLQQAEDFIESHKNGRKVFAGVDIPALSQVDRQQILTRVLPGLRGALSTRQSVILQYDDSDQVMDFVGTAKAAGLSQLGAACPDHLVHTKRQPLFVEWKPAEGIEALEQKLKEGVQGYVQRYIKYFEENSQPGDQMFDPNPRVVLIPGIGMITVGSDAQLADVSAQLYHRAIRVIEGSTALGGFESLNASEVFAVEYWPLEIYKLQQKPAPRELAGKVAVVTGGASGIGRATARRLAEDGAHVVIFDINLEGAQKVAEELSGKHGYRRGMAVRCDVTSEEAVEQALEQVILAYGGVDIVVSNAGIAISAPIEETSIAQWNRTFDILAKGYFLVSRAAFKAWKAQGLGGSLIYVASKNSVAAGKNAAAYSAAKAAELHLARCLAEEGGAFGIRVNSVMPDGVLEGSSIWDDGWRAARAAGYGIKPEELEEFYRKRTTLKVNVFPENIAEAISFLAGPRASRTTGGVITVDGGVSSAYVR
ncbi:MAG TPA: bifunctional aldolase/short-chain dehydrogenase [Chloroflexia bacterium]|nr:bifunctional aldolase/short-chain dehydrogenase [Chloroflexia bacterium]